MHCLNLKLTYKCTNHCPFCFSTYLNNNKITLEGLKEAIKKGFSSGCRGIVLSGGEPTLVPEILLPVLVYAEDLGYEKYILQTNGSGFSANSELLPFFNSIAKKKIFCVSFSIHGHTANLHDSISMAPGAFDKLLYAITKVKESYCKIYTNTVVSKLNISYLNNIAKFLIPYSPSVMQFSMIHLDKINDLCPSLLETSNAIKKLKGIISTSILKTEGIPFCLMYGMESCVGESFWPNKLDIYNYENNYLSDFTQLGTGMRTKETFCTYCIMNDICMGVWKEHQQEFRNLNIRPIK